MNKNIPIRQHYIPQFILKNFSSRDDIVNYYDISLNEFKEVHIRDIFMEKRLYDDEINKKSFPQQIEIDLSKFESEVSVIIKKMVEEDNINLSMKEDEKLKLFLAIMAFRNVDARNQFISFKEKQNNFYSKYQSDQNYEDFWKRNLGYLVNCRTLNDVLKHELIDEPIKAFISMDVFYLSGLYFLLFEKRGKENFIIGDCYPTVITGDNELFLYSYFPISLNRILVLVPNEIEFVPQGILDFDKRDLKRNNNILHINVRKIYSDKVKRVNNTIIKNCKKGFINTNI